jgi:hypothetical protein
MPPAFVFVDPYSFKVPGHIVRQLLSAGRVEVFINVIWRELDMAIAQTREKQDGGMVEMLNLVFGGEEWRAIGNKPSIDARADHAVDLLRNLYGARWATSIRMLGDNGITRYVLAHLTNHEAGRDLMKDCMWAVCPDGGYYARRSDNPKQTMLIEAEPNLAALEEWLNDQLKQESLRWSSLSQRIRKELWRNVHLSEVILNAGVKERLWRLNSVDDFLRKLIRFWLFSGKEGD